jgi:hypothetical protein
VALKRHSPNFVRTKRGLPAVRSVCDDVQRPVIIAMIAVRMVQMTVDQIIDVIPMGHRLMSAARAVHMPRLVTAAAVIRGAVIGIFRTHLDDMLIHVVTVRIMEMAIMQIVDVIAVANGGVATAWAMLMVVFPMVREIACAHRLLPSPVCRCVGVSVCRSFGVRHCGSRTVRLELAGPAQTACRVRDLKPRAAVCKTRQARLV